MITTKLDIYHLNCFKLTDIRREELKLFLEEQKPDVVSLNKIKLNENEANYFLRFENYVPFYKIRSSNPRSGGGVALIIKESLNPVNVKFDEFETDEIIGAMVLIEKK